MRIISQPEHTKGPEPLLATCPSCTSVLEIEKKDCHRTHPSHGTYFQVGCPVCNIAITFVTERW